MCSCYSINRYKPLQNRLLRKPLQTVTNQLLREPLQTVTKSYKQLQTIYTINHYKPLHYQSDTTVYPLVQLRLSRVTTVDTLSQWLLDFNLKHYELLS